MAFYYTGTDANPPAGAAAQPMAANNLAPALHAWLLLTTNPTWISSFANGILPAGMDLNTLAAQLGITPGCLQFVFDFAKDTAVHNAMYTVANQFQAINRANMAGNAYDFSCPDFADLRNYL